MADINYSADILAQLQDISADSWAQTQYLDQQTRYMDQQNKQLRSIDNILRKIARGQNISVSNGVAEMNDEESQTYFRDLGRTRRNPSRRGTSSTYDSNRGHDIGDIGIQDVFNRRNIQNKIGNISDEFFDGLENELMALITGNTLKGHIETILNNFTQATNIPIGQVPSVLGKALANNINSSLKKYANSPQGQKAVNSITNAFGGVTDKIKNLTVDQQNGRTLQEVINATKGSFMSALSAEQAAGATAEAAGVKAFSAALTEAGPALATIAPYAAIAAGALIAIDIAAKPLKETFKDFDEKLTDVINRFQKSAMANLDSAQKRLVSDAETMVKQPFEILQKAANEWYSAWDNNLRTITATQGYSKEDLQTLMGNFSERLRSEGLSSYVSASDITNNLANVLKNGLTGTVAEEFSYLATKLNAAVPTQDFFQYADVYGTLVSDALRQGKSQAEAISIANDTLKKSASNVLYASRELTNGVATGLSSAKDILEKSVQIAQISRNGDATEISGVLTAVSAVVGAVAPDLASSLTDAVYKASVGGNSSEIVALRSLAGINASNTEFLNQISDNPQKVFANLFDRLANMQAMSQDAYMEVAEGLSSIFGLSMDTFARVDFAYLAKAITNMSTTSSAIDENIELLKSGQTTTNAEQLKMQQINKYIIDEGLAYVIDNEAARMIQEHMWDEQRDRQLMEATYGVELQGAALKFLEGIRQTIDNILLFINPIGLMNKVAGVVASAVEVNSMKSDVAKMLELGKVGTGQQLSKYQLTTRNKDLKLTDSLVSLMGGTSMYDILSGSSARIGNTDRAVQDLVLGTITGSNLRNAISSIVDYAEGKRRSETISEKSVNSKYNWGTISKSIAGALFSSRGGGSLVSLADVQAANASSTSLAQARADQNLQKFLDSMDTFVKNDKNHSSTYEDWMKTANRYGIADFESAIESAGITDETLRGRFGALEAQIGAQVKADREAREEEFWNINKENIVNISMIADSLRTTAEEQLLTTIDFKDMTDTMLNSIFDVHNKFYEKFTEFYNNWIDYYVNHTAYSNAYDHSTVSAIQREEKAQSEDAVYALADALTQNSVDLLDPTVQQNALLAQILKVTNAILNATNTPSGGALPDSLSAMALGMTAI